MFAFSSLGVKIDKSVWGPKGIHTFRIQGELCHLIGSLLPETDRTPAFQQIYVFDSDPDREVHQRLNLMDYFTPNVQTVKALQDLFWNTHPYCKVLKSAKERIQSNQPIALSLQSVRVPRKPESPMKSTRQIPTINQSEKVHGLINSITSDLRRYNRPTASEVAVLIEDDDRLYDPEMLSGTQTTGRRDIIIQERNNGKLHRISELHSLYGPLRFPVMFPYGEHGWHIHLWRNDSLST
jgi:hypothetical protein